MTHPVSTAKSSYLAGSTLHPAQCTQHLHTAPSTCKCPWIWICTLHTTYWTLYTAHHMFIVHFENLSLHTANIQNLPVLVSRFTWRNVPWFMEWFNKNYPLLEDKGVGAGPQKWINKGKWNLTKIKNFNNLCIYNTEYK